MKLPTLSLSRIAIPFFGLLLFSCTKSNENPEELAECEYYLAGLSYNCTGEVCEYTATLENPGGTSQFDLDITQATYDHYKDIAAKQQSNVCWEGQVE